MFFFQRRVRQHRLFAHSSTDSEIRRCHARLAAVYEAAHRATPGPQDSNGLLKPPYARHSRENGNPGGWEVDSRFCGNDG